MASGGPYVYGHLFDSSGNGGLSRDRLRPLSLEIIRGFVATMAGDLLAVLEAAYTPRLSETEWLAGLLGATAPLLDEGLGIFAHTYEIQTDGIVDLRAIQTPSGRHPRPSLRKRGELWRR